MVNVQMEAVFVLYLWGSLILGADVLLGSLYVSICVCLKVSERYCV